jgi:hypothetical protein
MGNHLSLKEKISFKFQVPGFKFGCATARRHPLPNSKLLSGLETWNLKLETFVLHFWVCDAENPTKFAQLTPAP